MHDNENGKQERTATSRQQRQQVKDNGGEVGESAAMNRRGGFMFVFYQGGVNIKYNNQPDDDA